MIYVVGDSHSLFFDGRPGFKVNHIGPHCAYNLDKHVDQIVTYLGNETFRNGDECLLAFGEIDCRAHLPLRPKEIPVCVNRYAMAATSIRDRVPGLFFGFWGPTPSCPSLSWIPSPSGWEVAGTMQERNRITREFNHLLSDLAKEIGFYYVSIFEWTVKGLVSDTNLFYDMYHLDPKKTWHLAVEAWREYRGENIGGRAEQA